MQMRRGLSRRGSPPTSQSRPMRRKRRGPGGCGRVVLADFGKSRESSGEAAAAAGWERRDAPALLRRRLLHPRHSRHPRPRHLLPPAAAQGRPPPRSVVGEQPAPGPRGRGALGPQLQIHLLLLPALRELLLRARGIQWLPPPEGGGRAHRLLRGPLAAPPAPAPAPPAGQRPPKTPPGRPQVEAGAAAVPAEPPVPLGRLLLPPGHQRPRPAPGPGRRPRRRPGSARRLGLHPRDPPGGHGRRGGHGHPRSARGSPAGPRGPRGTPGTAVAVAVHAAAAAPSRLVHPERAQLPGGQRAALEAPRRGRAGRAGQSPEAAAGRETPRAAAAAAPGRAAAGAESRRRGAEEPQGAAGGRRRGGRGGGGAGRRRRRRALRDCPGLSAAPPRFVNKTGKVSPFFFFFFFFPLRGIGGSFVGFVVGFL